MAKGPLFFVESPFIEIVEAARDAYEPGVVDFVCVSNAVQSSRTGIPNQRLSIHADACFVCHDRTAKPATARIGVSDEPRALCLKSRVFFSSGYGDLANGRIGSRSAAENFCSPIRNRVVRCVRHAAGCGGRLFRLWNYGDGLHLDGRCARNGKRCDANDADRRPKAHLVNPASRNVGAALMEDDLIHLSACILYEGDLRVHNL